MNSSNLGMTKWQSLVVYFGLRLLVTLLVVGLLCFVADLTSFLV